MSFFDNRVRAGMEDPEFAAGFNEADAEIQDAFCPSLVVTSCSGAGFAAGTCVSSYVPLVLNWEQSTPLTAERPSTETTFFVPA